MPNAASGTLSRLRAKRSSFAGLQFFYFSGCTLAEVMLAYYLTYNNEHH